uniref:Uncharacterized protein n=1 Tax=Trametes coccinea TaxID=158605 RepID=A0A7S9A2I8_TRACO|nr:hypothetical protein J6656_mgp35 [Trametes coccinea]QPF23671.1 hypothetical protein [Trametes coccinea]
MIDQKLDSPIDKDNAVKSSLEYIRERIDTKSEESVTIEPKQLEDIKTNVEIVSNKGQILMDKLNDLTPKEKVESLKDMLGAAKRLSEILDSLYKGGNKFISDFNL